MKLTEHLIFLALLTPTVAVLSAAVVSLAVPLPALNTSDTQTLVIADYEASYPSDEQP